MPESPNYTNYITLRVPTGQGTMHLCSDRSSVSYEPQSVCGKNAFSVRPDHILVQSPTTVDGSRERGQHQGLSRLIRAITVKKAAREGKGKDLIVEPQHKFSVQYVREGVSRPLTPKVARVPR